MARQVKSKQRVADHGEVFTAEREVEAMCDLVKQETERIDSRFLEPACGDGNFLSVILKRKLAIVKKKYKRSAYDWERNSLLALGSLYGVDIMLDNVVACQERLFEIWNKEYKAVCKKECNDETREAAKFILKLNIVCGNALTLLCVDGDGCELNVPIIFSEWTFPFNDARMQRKDYTFAELLAAEEPKEKKKKKAEEQLSLMDMGLEAPEEPSDEGVFLQQYISHYRRIYEDDTRWREAYLRLPVKEENSNGYVNAKDCFAGISLGGGVCYFLWDRDNPRKCEFTNIHDGKESTDLRDLSEFPVFVRYNEAISVIRKVLEKNEKMVSEVVGSRNPFGLSSSARGVKDKREITLYSSAGTGYVTEHEVHQGKELIKKYKVMISKVTSEHAGEPDKSGMFAVLSTIRVLKPYEVCTDSYLIAYEASDPVLAENFANYMCTKFFRFLLLQAVSSINLSKDKFQFVPMQDFTKAWTDEMLYEKYNLSQDEIDFIESMMKEKEIDGGTK